MTPADNLSRRIAAVQRRVEAACRRAGRNPADVTLIAVTKGFPPEAVREAADAGLVNFGENRVQEAQGKLPALADLAGVTWHMIGHLQTNKVKTTVTLFDTIHSVDSLHLAEEISRRAPHTVPVFLEVNIAAEAAKSGFSLSTLRENHGAITRLPNLDIRGLMTVAPVTAAPEAVRPVFRQLRESALSLGLTGLSMGMTDDFELAIDEGATHIRVGRAIFGDRD